jgi:hypothetical protein
MAKTNYFAELRKYCASGGFEVYSEEKAGLHWITIFHREVGPIVSWVAYDGTLDGTARYALIEASRHRLKERGIWLSDAENAV